MATKLGLFNGALFLCKQRKLATLTDDELARYTLDDHYDKVLAYMLERAHWNFATRTVAIEHSEDVEPSFGFAYAFEKPDDWVDTITLSANGTLWPTLGANEFADETTNWHASCDPLYASYVSDHADFGGDLSMWPASYERAVEHELAQRIAPFITSFGRGEMDDLKKDARRYLAIAKANDATNQAAKVPNPGRLVMSRMGRSSVTLRREG